MRTDKQQRAQRRNSIKFRLQGAICAVNFRNYHRDILTGKEISLLNDAHIAIERLLKNFRAASTELGFGEPRLPKKFVMTVVTHGSGYEAYYRRFAALTFALTLEDLEVNSVHSLNEWLKNIGSSKVITKKDITFKYHEDEINRGQKIS